MVTSSVRLMPQLRPWSYTPAKIYTAPLNNSAIGQQGEGVHNEFVSYIPEYVEFMMREKKDSPLYGHVYNPTNGESERQSLPEGSRPDYIYDDENIRIIGDAKVNLRDLRDSHTAVQFVNYVKNLLSSGYSHKDKYILVMTPFNLGAVARGIIEDEVFAKHFTPQEIAQINVLYASEIDGHSIAAPDGWENIDFTAANKTTISTKHHGIIEVEERWIPVSTLKFDGMNSRLLGIMNNSGYTQDECRDKLLRDGDCSRNEEAMARRGQMLAGTIKEPLWVTSDFVVHDGNSRLCYARYIVDITGGHAPGYEYVRCFVFPEGTDEQMLADIKQEKQAAIALEHGRRHDALDMWRRVHRMGQDIDYIVDNIYTGRYSVEIAQQAVETVDWLINNGYNSDKMIEKLYYPCYTLGGVNWGAHGRKWAAHGITRKSVLDAAATATDEAWRTARGIGNLVPLMKDTSAPDYKIEAIRNFINQVPEWDTVKGWKENFEDLKIKNTGNFGAQRAVGALKRASTETGQVSGSLDNVRDVLQQVSTGQYTGENWKKDVYSRNKLGELSEYAVTLQATVNKLCHDLMLIQNEYTQAENAAKRAKKAAKKATASKTAKAQPESQMELDLDSTDWIMAGTL